MIEQPAKNKSASNATDKSGKSGQVMDDIVEGINASAQEVKEQIEDYSEEATEAIKKSPLVSVSIALGIGLLLGMLFKK